VPTADTTDAYTPTSVHIPFAEDPHRTLAYRHPVKDAEVQVWEHPREAPDGRRFRQHRIVVTTEHSGVAVLPITHYGRIALIRIWRPVIGAWTWEIPRGFGESADALADAARELDEETGLFPIALIPAGHVHPDTGWLADHTRLVIARVAEDHEDNTPPDALSDDAHEISQCQFFSRDAIRVMIRAGQITDATTLSAITVADAYLD
jgi:8-oxo-dGTP pyrophosphatase MutT (NUDIX family)